MKFQSLVGMETVSNRAVGVEGVSPQEFVLYFFLISHRNVGHIPGRTFSGMFPMRIHDMIYRPSKGNKSTR